MWESVLGQRRAKNLLRAAIESGRVPHAWLFTGQEGVGKDAAAIEVARVLRCENPGPQAVPCEKCRGCVTTGALRNSNVRFIFALPVGKGENSRTDSAMMKLPDTDIAKIQEQIALKAADPYHNISIPKAQQIKISSIREIKRDIAFTSVESGWRIIIVSEAHMMGEEAANAFLKTLEEPSSNSLLILTSSSRDRLLPTIRSRCQEVRFDLLTDQEIADALVERYDVDAVSAGLLSKLAGGSLSRAVELRSGDLNQLRFDVVTFLRAALRRSPLAMHQEIERLTSGGDRVRIERILTLLLLWLRDAYALRLTDAEDIIVNEDQLKDLQSFNSRFADASLEKMMEAVEAAIAAVRRNAQIPLVFTVLAMRLIGYCFPD